MVCETVKSKPDDFTNPLFNNPFYLFSLAVRHSEILVLHCESAPSGGLPQLVSLPKWETWEGGTEATDTH